MRGGCQDRAGVAAPPEEREFDLAAMRLRPVGGALDEGGGAL